MFNSMLIVLQIANSALPIKWLLTLNMCHFGDIFTKEQESIDCEFKL